MVKISQNDIKKNEQKKYNNKNKDIYLEIENENITPRHNKMKRKTVYDVLEDRKKISLREGSMKNNSLKDTIESVVIERNLKQSKNIMKRII